MCSYIYCFVTYVKLSVPVLKVGVTVSHLIPMSLGQHITDAHLISSKCLVNTVLRHLSSSVLKVNEGNVNMMRSKIITLDHIHISSSLYTKFVPLLSLSLHL